MNITKELMIKTIYDKIADKTLSFGVKYIGKTSGGDTYTREYILGNEIIKGENSYLYSYENNKVIDIISTIGHPVIIGDVLDYYRGESGVNVGVIFILEEWKEKRKPIEEQSEECIEYIYNIIK